jgi:hypothetical protein
MLALAACERALPVPTGAHLMKTAGDKQTGRVGQPLLLGPSVEVTDAKGNQAAGVPVGCQIISGKGTISLEQTFSGADGIANCGAWSLGDQSGLNQLQVYANGVEPVVFSAIGLVGPPAFQMLVHSPALPLTGAAIDVEVELRDVNPIAMVTATFAGREAQLSQESFGNQTVFFAGTVDLTGLDPGIQDVLLIRATDEHFGKAETGMLLTLDPAPDLLVSSPAEQLSFSGTSLQLAATASGTSDVQLTATSHGQLLAQGTNILLATVDLSAFDQQIDQIDFVATDTMGATTTVSRSVWVSSSPNLSAAANVPGVLDDFDGVRALHTRDDGTVMLFDFSSGSDDVIAFGPGLFEALGPHGAVVCVPGGFGGGAIIESGPTTELTSGCSGLEVEGNYAAVIDGNGFPWLADLTIDRMTLLSTVMVSQVSLAPSGDAVFVNSTGHVIHATPDGGVEALPLDESFHTNAVTDGTLIAYIICTTSTGCASIGIWDGAQEQRLTPAKPPTQLFLHDGWLAWTSNGTDTLELWVDPWPQPALHLAQQLAQPSPVAVLPGGTVIALDGNTFWRIPVSGAPEQFFTLGEGLGERVVQRNGHAYFLIAGLAVEVRP